MNRKHGEPDGTMAKLYQMVIKNNPYAQQKLIATTFVHPNNISRCEIQCLLSNRFLCNVYNRCSSSNLFWCLSSMNGCNLSGSTRRSIETTFIPFLSRAIVNDRNLCSLSEIDDLLPSSGSLNDDENELEFLLSRFQRCNGSSEEPTTSYLLNRVVSTCAKLASLSLGKQTHSAIIKLGFISNVFIGSSLVDMYSKCGMILKARQLFDEMPETNVVTWNSLISGYFHSHLSDSAIDLFTEMLKVGIFPTHFTLSAVLVSCSQLNAGGFGVQVHGLSLKTGSCSNIVVGTALIDMYSKCSSTGESRLVFDEMPERNVITWTSMVSGYAQNRQPDEALMLVREMRRMGIKLNKLTYNSLLSSFSSPDYLDLGKQVHCQVIREGLESDMYLVVTLLTMYSECGSMEDFCKICRAISTYDQVTWNSIITGFSHLGNGEEALDCFTRMRRAYISIDFFTFTNVLRAIGILSALDEGKQTHSLVLKSGYASNVFVQNGLVSMYARCGAIVDSIQVFSLISEPDLVSWNSLLSGCAQHGYGMEAVDLFEKMRTLGVKPDHTTFLSVLSACSHVGLLDRGIEYFNLMTGEDSSEQPRLEHYACMVDLLGRAGCLNEAESFISSMPLMPGPSVYKALLSACRVHGNLDIAIRSAKQLLELCPSDPATYVLLSSILAEGGHWIDAADVRKLMCERGVRKNPGCSWVDVNKYYVSVIGT